MKVVTRLGNLLHGHQGKSDPYFGRCPECWGVADSCYHIGRDEWFACDRCRTRWYFGSNNFSGWRYMTEEDFEANREKLRGYREVGPVWWGERRERWLGRLAAVLEGMAPQGVEP